jgi:uncharacterized OB-fold protein
LTELLIQRCDRCGTALFPDRLRCPGCGECSFTRIPAGPGVVEQQTTLRHASGIEDEIRLGSVRLAAGPVAIARLDDRTPAGAVVQLVVDSDGAIWGRAAPAPIQ